MERDKCLVSDMLVERLIRRKSRGLAFSASVYYAVHRTVARARAGKMSRADALITEGYPHLFALPNYMRGYSVALLAEA